jgi:hypothetical protein
MVGEDDLLDIARRTIRHVALSTVVAVGAPGFPSRVAILSLVTGEAFAPEIGRLLAGLGRRVWIVAGHTPQFGCLIFGVSPLANAMARGGAGRLFCQNKFASTAGFLGRRECLAPDTRGAARRLISNGSAWQCRGITPFVTTRSCHRDSTNRRDRLSLAFFV